MDTPLIHIAPMNALRREVLRVIETRPGRLDAIRVAAPESVEPQAWRRAIDQMLCDLQLDGVDVRIVPGRHEAPWLDSAQVGPA